MDIPIDLISKSLTGYCVCRFKNINFAPEAPPHYYVVIPIKDDSNLLLCIITSQIENKVWYYHKKNDKAISCLVRIDTNTFPFLEKESVIECNQPFLIPKNELIKVVDQKHKFSVVTRNIPAEIKKKIVKAINDSPLVKPYIKKMLS